MLRVVPWMCRKEWLLTYKNLYDFQDTASQVQGVQHVQAWKSRSGGKLPLSIEATASLVAATLSGLEDSGKSPLTVRLVMSMAIVRFVNGMVDMEQKGVYARSVQSIADDIGLPDWLVDLRHEATHAALPSLEVLRAGCEFSLGWLNDHYWQAQISEIKENDEKLRNLICSFVDSFKSDSTQGETKKIKRKKYLVKEIAQITSQNNMWDSVLDILLDKPGLLTPSAATLEQFTGQSQGITERPSGKRTIDLPKEAVAIWSPLLKALHKENFKFLSKLTKALIEKIGKLEMCLENVILARYFACWVRVILLSSSNVKDDVTTLKINVELDSRSILETCLQNVSSHTSEFLSLILKDLRHLPDKLNVKLEKLSSLISGVNAFNMNPDSLTSETNASLVKEYPELADYLSFRSGKSNQRSNFKWQLCENSHIRSVPIGGLVGCAPMEFESLELPREHNSEQVEGKSRQIQSCFTGSQARDVRERSSVDESSLEMQCDAMETTTKGLKTDLIKSISQEIWIF